MWQTLCHFVCNKPFFDQNRKRHCFTQLISTGNGVTAGITVATLYTVKERRTQLMEEVKETNKQRDRHFTKTRAN